MAYNKVHGYEFKCLSQYFLNFNVQRNDPKILYKHRPLCRKEVLSPSLSPSKHVRVDGAATAEACGYPSPGANIRVPGQGELQRSVAGQVLRARRKDAIYHNLLACSSYYFPSRSYRF